MHVGELTLTNPGVAEINVSSSAGRFSDLVARILGCWHTQMSRPFSRQGQAYRSCLSCGAQRKFNLGDWKMQGDFYYNRTTTSQMYPLAAVRRVQTN